MRRTDQMSTFERLLDLQPAIQQRLEIRYCYRKREVLFRCSLRFSKSEMTVAQPMNAK